MTKRKMFGAVTFLFLMMTGMFMLAGCGNEGTPPLAEHPGEERKQQEQEEESSVKIAALYFVSGMGDKLVKEEREIREAGSGIEVIVLEELIRGPQDLGLNPPIPPDVKVLGVRVEDGIAAVDLSEEIRSSHWGGSTGEILTVYSIVNTLVELPGIERVRFFIEGEQIETLVGHLDMSEPIDPDWGLVED